MLCNPACSSLTCSKVNNSSFALQEGSPQHHQLQAESADSFLNLLLLADSSLGETSTALDQQESMLTSLEDAEDALAPMANSNGADGCSHQQPAVQQGPEPSREHHTVAGIVLHAPMQGIVFTECMLSCSRVLLALSS